MTRSLLWGFTLFLILGASSLADWTPYWAQLKRSEKPSDYITGLSFLDRYFPLDLRWIGRKPITSVLIHGHFQQKECELYFGKAKANVDSKGFFKVKVELDREDTEVQITAACPDAPEAETVHVHVKEVDFFQLKK